MTAREMQAFILAADLMPTEKLAALAICTHWNERKQSARLYQRTLAAECGVSERTIRRALQALKDGQFFEQKITGRSTIFNTGIKLNISSVDRTPMSYQIGHGCPLKDVKKQRPWELDTEFSTRAEEEYKRQLRGQNDGHAEDAN